MAIHVNVGYRDGFCDKGKPYVDVIDKTFELSQDALAWWKLTGFNDGDGSVEDVLKAAKNEYVGTEHEIMTAGTKLNRGNGENGYTKMWCCIEGQEGKDTFERRHPDLLVDEIIDMGGGQFQLNGQDTDGKRTWQTIHIQAGLAFKISTVINLPE